MARQTLPSCLPTTRIFLRTFCFLYSMLRGWLCRAAISAMETHYGKRHGRELGFYKASYRQYALQFLESDGPPELPQSCRPSRHHLDLTEIR